MEKVLPQKSFLSNYRKWNFHILAAFAQWVGVAG